MFRTLLLCAVLLPLMGCGDDSNDPSGGNPDSGDPAKVTYAESLGVDLSAMTLLPSGLYIQDLGEPGTGAEAVSGAIVSVRYTGWLPNGTMFDSTENKAAFSFVLGRGSVIAGWDQGIAGMRVGGKRRLVIPSSLGYGRDGSPPRIPSYSVLVFDTELVAVR